MQSTQAFCQEFPCILLEEANKSVNTGDFLDMLRKGNSRKGINLCQSKKFELALSSLFAKQVSMQSNLQELLKSELCCQMQVLETWLWRFMWMAIAHIFTIRYWRHPKLSSAGYDLLLYDRSGENSLFYLLKPPYVPNKLKEVAGQCKIYIQPLQKVLIDSSNEEEEIEVVRVWMLCASLMHHPSAALCTMFSVHFRIILDQLFHALHVRLWFPWA